MQAVDHLNEKRGWFGSEAFKLVDHFFQGSDYLNNPHAIAQYTQWATRGDRPELYLAPTPMVCVLSPNDPKYIVCSPSIFIRFNLLTYFLVLTEA